MSISVQISDGPLPRTAGAGAPVSASETGGADVSFEGVVRALEKGQPISALNYEIYEPMATRELHRLATEIVRKFGLIHLYVDHSRGRVPVGQCSFRLRVVGAHRAEALQAMAAFIDRLKQDVPIWKTAVLAAGEASAATPEAAGEPGVGTA